MASDQTPDLSAALRRLTVSVGAQMAGHLVQEENLYVFRYASDARAHDFVSLTMPVRVRDYTHASLLPIFEMHLPEGYLLALLQRHFAKLTQTDDFGILQLLAPAVRGRVHYPHEQQRHRVATPLTLDQLLQPEHPDLFQELVQRFALQSALSGVQPKVLATVLNKATLKLEDLIVKAWGPEYPELAANEYWCMRAMQAAGVPVPQFDLSDDGALFIVRRFDLPHDSRADTGQEQGYLGFEDMCVLQARGRHQKYAGSYEQIAKTIGRFASPQHKTQALQQFFKMMVLNCHLQNGDAHLKNFGLLYRSIDDIWLAPAYDVVCTTAYIQHDRPALTLLGKRHWPRRKELLRFGVQACGLGPSQAESLYGQCIDALAQTAPKVQQAAQDTDNPARKQVLQHLTQTMQAALV